MMWQDNYERWQQAALPTELRNQLTKCPKSELPARFEEYPEFGTGGIRALMGVGTNRLNSYTIARATVGVARYLQQQNLPEAQRIMVISFDTRFHSKEFAQLSACILAAAGITVYLSDKPRPTPELSFLVRDYHAFLGIMITASHNPYEYNGYKVYDRHGGQITLAQAAAITAQIEQVGDELQLPIDTDISTVPQIHVFGTQADDDYLQALQVVNQAPQVTKAHGRDLRIVYTPLHGTGESLITQGLHQAGFTNLFIVSEQSVQDPYFGTVELPNPEFHEAFALALKLAKKVDADVVIATDPDADRMGMAVKTEDGYQFLTGNQLGAIFVDYLIRKKRAQNNDLTKYRLIKTIVTSDFGRTIAAAHGIKTIETLTGFKFIGEQADQIEAAQDGSRFFLGYEESFGFLVAPFVRDKDSIQAAVLASEVALDAKRKGQTLPQILHQLEVQYGYFEDALLSDEFHNKTEEEVILKRVDDLRRQQPPTIAGLPVSAYEDYQKGERVEMMGGQHRSLSLPAANVLKIIFEDGSWLAVRPSGTEPKIKTYIAVRGNSVAASSTVLTQLTKYVRHSLYKKDPQQ